MLNERNIGSREDLRESLFLERYQRLLSWAMRVTNYDHAGAEDLVQDAFIQFTRGRTSLDNIVNLDGYLRRMLHYLNLARVTRHTEQMQKQALSIADYDSLSLGLRAFDIDKHLQIKEQLIDICTYACIRKETSRAGSVLILRYFHEYTPSEIGKLLCRPRHSVDEWQRVGRAEVKIYLDNPRQLSFVRSKSRPNISTPDFFIGQTDLTTALRWMIFNSRLGDCLSIDKLKNIYLAEKVEKLTTETLAHIVSCYTCLDAANRVSGLPSLSERFDIDHHDHFEPPNNGSGSAGSFGDIKRRLTKHLHEVVEHKPQQLCVRVNGVRVGSFRVDSSGSEFQMNLNAIRDVSFIDMSSEQGLPLLLFQTNAKDESWAQIDLSEGRLLEASLTENSLNVIYRVPESDHVIGREPLRLVRTETDESSAIDADTFWGRVISAFKTQSFLRAAWLSPACVTLLVAILLVATSLKLRTPSVTTARSLLERAVIAERQRDSKTGQVVHRVITFEELEPTGTLVSHQRIEVWADPTNEARADRIFDDHNHLVAERVQNKNGGSAVFHHPKTESQELSAEDISSLQPTARTFGLLVGSDPVLAMEQRYDSFVISYSGNNMTSVGQLLKATLTLTALDLHPIQQTLVIERGGQLREYRFTEVRFDQIAREELNSAVFHTIAEMKSSRAVPISSVDHDSFIAKARRTGAASNELESEAAYLLDRAKADHNEQITLLRGDNGLLRIEGVVETTARKNQLLQFLTPLINNPAVSINIQAADTVLKPKVANDLKWSTIRSHNATVDRTAVDRELREYLVRTKPVLSEAPNDLDVEVNALASQIVNRSYRALFHAVQLKQMIIRFSKTNMHDISEDARDKLRDMIQTHAKGFSREYVILRGELEPIFHSEGFSSVSEPDHIENDEQLNVAIEKLSRLASSNNEAIRMAFTVSEDGSSVRRLNSGHFWKDLVEAQQIALRIAKY